MSDVHSYRKPLHAAAAVMTVLLLCAWPLVSVHGYLFFSKNATAFPDTASLVIEYWQYLSQNPATQRGFLRAKVLAATALLALWLTGLFEIYKDRRSLHGDARWATQKEIKKAGLLAQRGILIGYAFGKYLVSGFQDFVLLAAPTRSGKGVSFVITNLLNWLGSVICMDTKKENFATTSAYRKHILRQEVYLFDPFSADCKTHRWNPLDEVRRNPVLMGGDVLQIAQIFYPERAGDKNPFFTLQAQNLFFGLTMLLLESRHERCSMAEVFRQGSGYDKPLRQHLEGMLAVHDAVLSRQCKDSLNRFLSNPEETFGNIKASFDAPLLMFANPLVDMATSASDFRLADVRRRRMTIYFGITPNRLGQAERLINLFFTQVISLNTEVLPEKDKSLKHQCLLINDEFTAFGRIAILVKAVSFIAGYNLRLLTIVQSKSQLEGDGLYSRADTRNLIVNHDIKVVFTPGDDLEAKDASEMLGTYTKSSTSASTSRNTSVMVVNSNGTSGTSTSDQRRALMLPQELKNMPLDKEIIDKKGIRPIFCEKIFYYKDPIFLGRLAQVSPTLRAMGAKLPSKDELDAIRLAGEFEIPVPALVIDPSLLATPDAASANAAAATDESSGQAIDPPPMTAQQIEASAQALAQRMSGWSDQPTPLAASRHMLAQFFTQDSLAGAHSHARI